MTSAPRLSVRAMAEMIGLPAYEQVRILHEQKYPRQQPQTFKVPFYRPALGAIREFYRVGNDPAVFATARNRIQQIRHTARRENNLRVMDEFSASRQARRNLTLKPGRRYTAFLGGVELRLQFELVAEDARGGEKRLFYNFRHVPIERAVARRTLEIASWVLQNSGVQLQFRALEYVDIGARRVIRATGLTQRTLRQLRQNARIIQTLWPTV